MERELLRKILQNTDESLRNDAKQNAEIENIKRIICIQKEETDDLKEEIDKLKAFNSKSKGAWFALIGIGTILSVIKEILPLGK